MAGGAQAGVAAAVASRLAGLGLALDTRGEAVAPAATCGVVAYRPSHGRYPLTGTLSLCPTMDALTVVARTVQDAALADEVILLLLTPGGGGADAVTDNKAESVKEEQPAAAATTTATTTRTTEPPLSSCTTASSAIAAASTGAGAVPDLTGLRLGLPRRSFLFAGLDPALEVVISGALGRLAKAGATLVELDLPGGIEE